MASPKKYDRWHDQSLLSLIKSGELKTRSIGRVDDINHESYGRSPGLDALRWMSNKVRIFTYQETWRVYSEELPLPNFKFLNRRSSYFLNKATERSIDPCIVWHKKSTEALEKLLDLV